MSVGGDIELDRDMGCRWCRREGKGRGRPLPPRTRTAGGLRRTFPARLENAATSMKVPRQFPACVSAHRMRALRKNSILRELGGDKLQSKSIDAVAQARGLRPVAEHVAEMTATASAMHLFPEQAERPVLAELNAALDGLIETRPAGAGLEFRLRSKDREIATGAVERAHALLFVERARPRTLRVFFTQNGILVGR